MASPTTAMTRAHSQSHLYRQKRDANFRIITSPGSWLLEIEGIAGRNLLDPSRDFSFHLPSKYPAFDTTGGGVSLGVLRLDLAANRCNLLLNLGSLKQSLASVFYDSVDHGLRQRNTRTLDCLVCGMAGKCRHCCSAPDLRHIGQGCLRAAWRPTAPGLRQWNRL